MTFLDSRDSYAHLVTLAVITDTLIRQVPNDGHHDLLIFVPVIPAM